ncbi:hypothetical protein BKA69DRAFT_298366 [Paraphysoderma sedebokerense]|nr:hypothetical protein BKA69DRAFT_298366 [Paraphysoderma sedebokerense]
MPSDVNLPVETVLSRHPVLAREDFKVLGVGSSVDDLLRKLYLILTAIGHESTKETTVKWIQAIRAIYRAKSYPNYKSRRTNGNGNDGDGSMGVTSASESTDLAERPCFWPSTVPYKESGHLNCRERALLIMSIFAKMPNTDDLIKIARRHQPFQDQPVRLLLLERFEVMARYPQIKGLDFHAIDPSSLPQRKQYRNLFSAPSQEAVNVSTSSAIEIRNDNSLNTNTISDSNPVIDDVASTVSNPANSLSPVPRSDSDIAVPSVLSSNVDAHVQDDAGSTSMANLMDASNHITNGEDIDNGNTFPTISVVHINGEDDPFNGGEFDDRRISSGVERIIKRRRRNIEGGMVNVERRTQRRVRINTRYSRVQELGFLQRRLE